MYCLHCVAIMNYILDCTRVRYGVAHNSYKRGRIDPECRRAISSLEPQCCSNTGLIRLPSYSTPYQALEERKHVIHSEPFENAERTLCDCSVHAFYSILRSRSHHTLFAKVYDKHGHSQMQVVPVLPTVTSREVAAMRSSDFNTIIPRLRELFYDWILYL